MGELVGLDSCSQSFLTHLPMVRSWDIITTKNFELGTHSARNGPGGLHVPILSDPGAIPAQTGSDPGAIPQPIPRFSLRSERSRSDPGRDPTPKSLRSSLVCCAGGAAFASTPT